MITYIQQEEVALNRRRNKVDMEKVFATVISLAIIVALVAELLAVVVFGRDVVAVVNTEV